MKEFIKYILFASGLIAIWGVLVEPGYAQGENNIWAFGKGSGLNFNLGAPVFWENSMFSKEGCAAISDAFGNLIFYTSGNMIWDKNGKPMPNGSILGNGYDGSGAQAALVLKSISNPYEYYVFTLDPQEVALSQSPKLRYSVVDMLLNNGLGDVKLSEKDVELDNEMEERMYAVEADDCGYWIVGHKRRSNIYVAFKLTASGISTPVYSYGTYSGFFNGSDPGEMKLSPDKSKIAIIFLGRRNQSGDDFRIEIGDFDVNTGIISNTAILDSNKTIPYQGYGLSFSPDNSKLYVTSQDYSQLFQYNMAYYPNVGAIRLSKVKIFETGFMKLFGMRTGPDNKIYLANLTEGYISCIQDPNVLGLACNFNSQHIAVPTSHYFNRPTDPFYGYALGNPTVAVTYKDTLPGKYLDTLICFSDSVQLAVEDNLLGYVWNDGITGASRYVHEEGIYYCLSTKECTMRRDTFKVTFVKGNFPGLGADTIICPGDSLVLSASGDGFQWQDGSTEPEYRVTQPGWYSVTVNEKGCYYSDSIRVAIYAPKAEILENDTLICRGQKLFLHGLSEPAGNFRWNTGSEEASLQITESGRYILEATNLCGVFYDSVRVQVQDCDCQPGIPTAFSPNNDGINDVFKVMLNCLPKSFGLSVYNRFGERIYSGYSQDEGWDGTYKGQYGDIGVYFYDLKYETPNGVVVRKKGDIVLVR